MKIEFSIPQPRELLPLLRSVPIAVRGQSWSETCLGTGAKDQGVYVIHHGDTILYVGKTDGDKMTFGVRLRREFQESASGGRHIFPKLAALKRPPDLAVYLFPASAIGKIVSVHGLDVSSTALIPVLEAVLIAAYKPVFQK